MQDPPAGSGISKAAPQAVLCDAQAAGLSAAAALAAAEGGSQDVVMAGSDSDTDMPDLTAMELQEVVQQLEQQHAELLQHSRKGWMSAGGFEWLTRELWRQLAAVQAAAAEVRQQQACAQRALPGMAAELRAATGAAGEFAIQRIQAAVLQAELGVAQQDNASLQQQLAESRFSVSIMGAQLTTLTAAAASLQQQLAQVQPDHAIVTASAASASQSAKAAAAAAATAAAELQINALQQQLQQAEHRAYSNAKSATEHAEAAAEERWVAVAIQQQLQKSKAAADAKLAAFITERADELHAARAGAEAQARAAALQAEKQQERRRQIRLASRAAFAGKRASAAAAIADAQQAREEELQAVKQELSEQQATAADAAAAAAADRAQLQQQLAEAQQQLAAARVEVAGLKGQAAHAVAGLPVASDDGSINPDVCLQQLQATLAASRVGLLRLQAMFAPAGL
jgi:hypothetical protein